MHLWSVERDSKTGNLVHTVTSERTHSLLAPIAGYGFRALGVSASIWEHEHDWFPIHIEPGVTAFEVEHDRARDRSAYNGRMFARVLARPTRVWGEHGGFSDLFVPIVMGGKVTAVLVTGPVAKDRPTAARVAERWQMLTGRQADTGDPEFMRYLGVTLSTLVLEGSICAHSNGSPRASRFLRPAAATPLSSPTNGSGCAPSSSYSVSSTGRGLRCAG